MKKKNITVQIIGHGLNDFARYLKHYNIFTESIISSCSPLAMSGKTDQVYLKYGDDPKISMPTLLNIRKNLSQMLSHTTDKFCSNYNTLPYGEDVRDYNSTDYLIMMNSAISYPLYEKNGVVFSHAWTGEEFINKIKSDSSYITRRFPFSDDFNWKHYYDNFIDDVMNEYDKDHIILIKINSAQWFMNDNNICFFDKSLYGYRTAVEEMDDYFAKRTSCLIVDEHYNHIPHVYVKNNFPSIIRSGKADKDLAYAVANLILSHEGTGQSGHFYTLNRLASTLCNRLSHAICKENESNLYYIVNNNLSMKQIEQEALAEKSEFWTDIVKLKSFLDYPYAYNLSIYAIELMANKKLITEKADYKLIELYTKYFKLDINDIIAFYMIYVNCSNKEKLREAAKNIVNNPDCQPVRKAKKICNSNIDILNNYPYINNELKGKNESKKIYICIENNSYIVFDLEEENFLSKTDFPNENDFNYIKIIDDGYICPIASSDALTYCYEYYAEKARRGDGNKPTFLKFKDINEFYDSLTYMEYKPLLENERFVFTVSGKECSKFDDYVPVVDFTELVDPNIALINVRNGLGDQICHFVMGEIISKETGRKVIYFDLPALKFIGQNNGSDFKRIAHRQIKSFSKIISSRLAESYNPNNDSGLSLLMRINNYNLIINNGYYNHRVIQNELKLTSVNGSYICDDVSSFVNTSMPYSYFFNLIRIEQMKGVFDYKLSDYIEFPPFEEQADIEICEKMLSCDAVVVHIRRGDRAALGWNEDIDFYAEAIEKIMDLAEYENKKFFVFSDDINWCKNHCEEVGLNKVENHEIFFIDGHKGEECFRDVQLMTLGKVMICGNSGFPRIAAMYSDRWEMFFCAEKSTNDFFHKYVRNNKYKTSPFLKKDYSKSKVTVPESPKIKVKSLSSRENIEWLNFWFDKGNEIRDDRILLIGDSISREYRSILSVLTNKPIDFFAGSADILDGAYWKSLDLFFSYSEYRQINAHIQIGVNGIDGVGNSVCSNDIAAWEKNYEKLVNYVLNYIPNLTIALTTPVHRKDNILIIDDKINNEIIKRNQVAKKIAEKYKLPINDLYTLMFNEPHRDWVHFPKDGSEKIARQTAKIMKLI